MPHAHYVQTRATLCKVKVKVKVNVDLYSFGKKIPTVYSKKFLSQMHLWTRKNQLNFVKSSASESKSRNFLKDSSPLSETDLAHISGKN